MYVCHIAQILDFYLFERRMIEVYKSLKFFSQNQLLKTFLIAFIIISLVIFTIAIPVVHYSISIILFCSLCIYLFHTYRISETLLHKR